MSGFVFGKNSGFWSFKLWIVLLVFFAFYVSAGSLSFDFPDFQDHSKAAERISQGSMLYRDHIRYMNVYHYPPVFLYALGGVYYLLGVDFLFAKGFLALFNILTAFLVYLIAKDFNEQTAFLCSLIFLANPLTLSAVFVGYFDNFVVFFMLLSIYCLIKNRPVLGGVALALGFMSKPFPILLLFAVLPYYLKEHRWRSISGFLLSFSISVVVISLPFLFLAPHDFLNYAFLYNFERTAESMSFYFYFLPELGTRMFPLLSQGVFLGWLSCRTFKSDNRGLLYLMQTLLLAFLGFFVLNRINYPHYLIYIVPFFSIILIREYQLKSVLLGTLAWKHLLLAFTFILLGCFLWSYPWSQGVSDFKSSNYFWTGSIIYYTSSVYLLTTVYLTSWRREGLQG